MEITAVILEIVLRTLVIVMVAFLIVRMRGKRQLGQLSLFDTIVLIVVGSTVGDVMTYPESVVSLTHSIIAIVALAVFVFAVEKIISWLPPRVSRIVYGEDTVIAYNGEIIKENLATTRLTEDQVTSRLREKGVSDLHEAKIVRLEADGDLSVERHDNESEQ